LVKAGSRFENKPGVAHALKNFAFKSTNTRSTIGTVRESELYGGVLTSSLSREHLALTAEFLSGDEEYFVDVLASFVTGARLAQYELNELVLPVVEADAVAASNDPATRALEVAHTIAFRHGLGASLFASQHPSFTIDDIKAFAASAFSTGNIAVLGTGIDQERLSKLVEKSLGKIPSSSSATAASTKYYGGETRVESSNPLQTVFIGFGTTGAPSNDLAALASHIAPEPHVKWSKGISQISEATPAGTTVQTVYLPYSDATLMGVLVQGRNAADVKTAAQAAVKALKSQVNETDAKRAIAKAKFRAASELDSRDSIVSILGSKVFSGVDASVENAVSSFDAVTSSSISSAASTLLKAKPTYVVVGDIAALPYADELGL